jgi:hypothetical protein
MKECAFRFNHQKKDLHRATAIIQVWHKEFCEFYGKTTEVLQIKEVGEQDTGF